MPASSKGRIGIAAAEAAGKPEQQPADELQQSAFARLVVASEQRDGTLKGAAPPVSEAPEAFNVQVTNSQAWLLLEQVHNHCFRFTKQFGNLLWAGRTFG